ncbi:uncharacterized protein At3g28850-like [Hordeum vulgare subsp. vulgare]|uniref:Glutaredoxin domain-containing protein n=1 Tax=Hordeum vulgare subsp. vulgare TaxID=112509 RepID=A0A8I6WYL1_HORVV|nr:uncharacterized protein At3g28850-like [Hordeum vulgare subsp. vulgare]
MRPPDMYDPGGSSSSSRPHGKHELQPEVVLYTSSASVLRRRGRTSADRYALRALLRGYGLTMDERDVSTSKAHRSELKSLLAARGCAFSLPQLLVGGRFVGGPDDVRQLHQAGGLRHLLDAAPRPCRAFVCQACKRVGSEPCPECSESRNKMLDRGIVEEEEEKERAVLFYPTQVTNANRGCLARGRMPGHLLLSAWLLPNRHVGLADGRRSPYAGVRIPLRRGQLVAPPH